MKTFGSVAGTVSLPDHIPQIRRHPHVHCNGLHRNAAQTVLGGALGGNLAFYTMITSKTGL